jgi:hypothetical protein
MHLTTAKENEHCETFNADAALLLLVCPASYSQDRVTPQEPSVFKGWRFDVAPFYLWIPALDGEVTVHGHAADVDLSIGDTLDLLFDSFKVGRLSGGRALCPSRHWHYDRKLRRRRQE